MMIHALSHMIGKTTDHNFPFPVTIFLQQVKFWQ